MKEAPPAGTGEAWRETMGYTETEDESTPVAYAVFSKREPRHYVSGNALNWQLAREHGARKLKLKFEDVWAVAIIEGETAESAVSRGNGLLKSWDRGGK